MRKLALVTAAVATLMMTLPAEAAVVTTDYSFTGSATGSLSLACENLTGFCSLAAFSTVIGSTTFDLSNTGLINNTNGGFPTPILLSYTIGGAPNGFNGIAFGQGAPDDFIFNILVPITTPATANTTIVLANTNGSNGQIMISLATPGIVPEPATWAMMLLGFGAIGFAMRRRKTSEARAA